MIKLTAAVKNVKKSLVLALSWNEMHVFYCSRPLWLSSAWRKTVLISWSRAISLKLEADKRYFTFTGERESRPFREERGTCRQSLWHCDCWLNTSTLHTVNYPTWSGVFNKLKFDHLLKKKKTDSLLFARWLQQTVRRHSLGGGAVVCDVHYSVYCLGGLLCVCVYFRSVVAERWFTTLTVKNMV